MAIQYSNVRVIHAGNGSVVGLSAYIARTLARDETTGQTFSYSHFDDLIDAGVMLPAGAERYIGDNAALWNDALEEETTVDRKTKSTRFKKQAQVGISYVIALPKELSREQRRDMAEKFIAAKFFEFGVAVQWAVHDDTARTGNHHLHILHTTRRLTGGIFANKVRELQPTFIRGGAIVSRSPGEEWKDFQDRYFVDHELDLRVDPTRIVPSLHEGETREIIDSVIAGYNKERAEQAKAACSDTSLVLNHMTKSAATFTERDLVKFLRKSGLEDPDVEDRAKAIMDNEHVISLSDTSGAITLKRYTTRAVIDQEETIVARISKLAETKRRFVSKKGVEFSQLEVQLDGEQQIAFEHAINKNGFALIQGRAGTGKSHTLKAIRLAYEYDDYDVRGLAPTNIVARDMSNDGFLSSTIDKELRGLDLGKRVWTNKTVIVVEEAGMASAKHLDGITREATRVGAKLILVGDDRQLQSIERGGLFSLIAKRLGSVELNIVRRQKVEWQRKASEALSKGELANGLRPYVAQDRLHALDTLDAARANLVRDYMSASVSGECNSWFAFAATNEQVDKLNGEIRAARHAAGEVGEGRSFKTRKGVRRKETVIASGDRIQFHTTDKRIGVLNGEVATVIAIKSKFVVDSEIVILTALKDDGQAFTFNPIEQDQWSLGYAGTVYSAQGKSIDKVFALYDDVFAWNRNATYVALTRQKADLRIYGSWETLRRGRGWSDELLAEQAPRVGFIEAQTREIAGQMLRQDGRQAASMYERWTEQPGFSLGENEPATDSVTRDDVVAEAADRVKRMASVRKALAHPPKSCELGVALPFGDADGHKPLTSMPTFKHRTS